jgi:protein-L-isoaspartate(D-aspartate) O-methyltransferase
VTRSIGVGLAVAAMLMLPISAPALDEAALSQAREQMVARQLAGRDITDARVLSAMGRVRRHLFVRPSLWGEAYDDHALPIAEGQTISQPYIVALMTQLLELTGRERVLEVGTGSGYQAAILAELSRQVFTIEILPALAQTAAAQLSALGYRNVEVRAGDGYRGWPEQAPFDAIVVTAGATHIPGPLIEQLKEGGRLVIPVGASSASQELLHGRKEQGRLVTRVVAPVRFVPLVEPKR